MMIKELEETYQQLHQQLLRGELDEEEFKAEVERLRFEDEQGRQWKIGWYTGQWYRYDEGQWIQDQPQEHVAPLPAEAETRPQDEQERSRRPVAAWLVPLLIVLLILAAAVLVIGWGADWWGGPSEVSVADTSTPAATAPLPTATALPTEPPPAPTNTSAPTSKPTQTPLPTATKPSPTEAPTEPPTATPTPEDTPTTAATTESAQPAPTSPPVLSGRILFPVYDPSADRRTFDIFAFDLESGEREIVIGQASQPALSHDAKRLAYRSWDNAQRGILVREQADGHTWVWVNFSEAARPSWSPDNQNIVFPSQQEPDREWRIYRTWGTETDRVRRHGGDILGRVPIWLSDGRIVYWECALNECGLYAMQEDGTNPTRLTTSEHDTAPAASPDGSQIAFTSNRDGNWEVYIANTRIPAGQAPAEAKRLTRDGSRDGLPVWSPDGKWLAFVSDRGGDWAVWVMRPDGSSQRKLFDLGGPLEGEIAGVSSSIQHDWTWETLVWEP